MGNLKFPVKLILSFIFAAVSILPSLAGTVAPPSQLLAGHIRTAARPEARVTRQVENSVRTTLRGHLSGALRRAQDLGRLNPSTPAQHMVMVLQSSDAQKAELRRVLDEQQDSRTTNYHQWITPDDFGAHFGVADADIAQVTAWLQSQGFTVEDVAKSKRLLHFSGTTGQIEKAFKTEMHNYQVNGEAHVSNNSEISVPTALHPVIAGVSLHNFFRKGHMGPVKKVSNLIQSPDFTNGSTHYVGPTDFATIYNTTPLLSAGINGAGSSIAVVGRSDILLSDVQTYRQGFNLPPNDPIFIHAGQDNGITPGDDGESDLDVEISGGIAPMAKLYFVIGTPTYFVDGITNSIQYIVENNLADIMSISYGSCEANSGAGGNAFNSQAFEQAAAQGISIFVSSGDNGPAECDNQNDTYEVLGYATGSESSTPYSVSVGGSEFNEGSGTYWLATNPASPANYGTATKYIPEYPWNGSKNAITTTETSLSGLWSGSGGISSYYLRPSWQSGPGITALVDPPLTQGGNWVTGVTLTNGGGSGYTTAPSVTWTAGNCITLPATASTTINAGGSVTGILFNYGTQGGTLRAGQGFGCTAAPTATFSAAPTGGTTAKGTATIGPMWNTLPLISGVPHRLTPDLSLNAASGHDGTAFCSEGVCKLNSTGGFSGWGAVGGTSVAAPSMAGIQALINQANGGRQGAPNYIYYALAAAQSTTNCNSSTPPLAGSNCAFQDITAGDNMICGTSGCSGLTARMGFYAGVGYDLATGLGSVNAYNLSSQWKSVVFNSTNTALTLSKTTGIPQGTPVTISGTVAPGSGSGTPTGDVAFILSQGAFGQTVDVDSGGWSVPGTGAYATLSGGSYTATVSNLPAGTYTLTARYGGDQTYASSLSAPITVTVAPGNSQVAITPEWFNDTVTCSASYVNSYTYGQFAWIPAAVTATSGSGVPTGTVIFTVDGVPYATETLDPQGNAYLAAGTISTGSCLYDYMFAQSPTLTGGTHVIGATYSGDNTFSPATATTNITVTKLAIAGTVSTGETFITSGASVPLTAAYSATSLTGISTQSSGPTGTVTFTDNTTSTVLGTATVNPTVRFSGNTYTFAANAAISTSAITGTGVHSITAAYSGDSNFNSATSAALTITVGTPAATTTTVTSSANPTTLNGRPTLTATVAVASGTAPTSGIVSFYDNYTGSSVLLGTGTVGSTHTATFRPAAGAAFWGGTHPITAVYAGIAADAGSTSAVFNQVVTQGTNAIALSGKLQGAVGQTYTFAAVLTPSQTNATFAPNQGVVTFYDGATAIGTAQPITVTSAQGGYGLWTATMSTSSLTAGTHSITAAYSDINYSLTTSAAQTVTVEGISWATPAAITYPAALSATQLNATDTVVGTFTYTPALGTVLNAGPQTLSVTFNPTDTTHYVPQTTTVQLTVNQAASTVAVTCPPSVSYTGVAQTPCTAKATGAGGLNQSLAVNYTNNIYTGTATASATFAGDANYTGASNSTTFAITKALVTVTANNTSRAVGAANPTFTASYSGFMGADTSAVLSGAPSLTTTATTSSLAGTYPITTAVGSLTAANYTFAFVNGTLSVVSAPTVVLTTTATVTGSASNGYIATIKVTNSGTGAASNVTLTSATLGTTAGSPLPQTLASIAAGGSGTFTVSFPGTVGADGAGVAEKYAGTYTGGSFSASVRSVTLP